MASMAGTWWLLLLCVLAGSGWMAEGVGVNWGAELSHPLPPSVVVQMLNDNRIHKLKLFGSDPDTLQALSGSNIEVMLGIPNDMLEAMTEEGAADGWVRDNVSRYIHQGGVNVKYVAVGNEPFLKTYNDSFTNVTLPALQNIQNALNKANLGDQIKATVPLNPDIIITNELPSGGMFRSDIADVMDQITAFLNHNNCPFTINIYPFIVLYSERHFPKDYAFFDGNSSAIIDGSYVYQNVFDVIYDSLVAALMKAGFPDTQIIVGEIGWPTDGDVNASPQNAQRFNQGFINHISSNVGTPLRPNTTINSYLLSLIDEDQKSVAPGNFERHWGIFKYDGQAKYPLSLPGSNRSSLVNAQGVQYLPQQWCVLNTSTDASKLGGSVTCACMNSDCTSLGFGCSCNPYLDLKGNASYAFNQYYQAQNQQQGSCDFDGLGMVTTRNPSVGSCEFMVEVAYSSDLPPASCQ